MVKRFLSLVMIAVFALSMTACGGPLSRVQDLLPYVPAVIDLGVRSGKISQELGDKLKDDLSAGQVAVNNAKTCLDANLKPNSVCYLELGNAWREILGRNHFAQANDHKVTTVITLITDIINLVVRKNTQPVGVRGTTNFDREIKLKVKQLESELEVVR